MSTRSIVVMCMPERGHLHRLLPLVDGLASRGRRVTVITDARFRADVEQVGGEFVDLFDGRPLDAADATSRPVPSRYVSFAGVYASEVTTLLASLDPALVLYDTFAVVAPVAAARLGRPYVNVCAGHAMVPDRIKAALRGDPRVALSDECLRAVERLRAEPGWAAASPFSYVDGLSPYLNLYCEPEAFLDVADRPVFEPLAFVGSLPARALAVPSASERRGGVRQRCRVYLSLGTVAWRYFAREALAALTVITEVLAGLDVDATVSLGGHPVEPDDLARLGRSSVRVEGYVDQWQVLAGSDLFVTHHGLNSTHEAILHEVPMLSYPLFSDQPALARRAAELGLALPLAAAPRAMLEPARVRAALERVLAERESFAARLATARAWELATVAARGAIFDRLEALARW